MGIMKPNSMSTTIIEEKTSPNEMSIMEELIKSRGKGFLKVGDIAKGTVLSKRGANLFIDLGDQGTAIIFGKEYQNAKDVIKNLKPGDAIEGKVVMLENENGLMELSIKEAGADVLWKDAATLRDSGEPLELKVTDSNKGGLVLEWRGVKGFLPASQLKAAHYPKVEGGDKDKISEELKKMVGESFSVVILDIDPKEEKLIFSEKGTESEELKKIVEKYKVGDIVEGEVTGVVEFGIFIKIEEGLEGLAHISELGWGLGGSPSSIFKVGGRE